MIPNTGILAYPILPCIASHFKWWTKRLVWLVLLWALRRGLNTYTSMWVESRTIAAPGQISFPLCLSLPPQLSCFFLLHPQTLAAPSISVSSCSTLQTQMTVSWHPNGATGEEAAYTPHAGDKPCQTSSSHAALGHYISDCSLCKALFMVLNWFVAVITVYRIVTERTPTEH